MHRRPRAVRFMAVALGVLAAAPILTSARPADALFRYFSRKNLAHALENEPEKWVETSVVVTDRLVCIFKENAETDTAEGTKFVRFDTDYFRCAIDANKDHKYIDTLWEDAQKKCKDCLDKIEEINEQQRTRKKSETDAAKERREVADKMRDHWKAQPIVTVYGKVSRADFYTPGFYKEDPKRKPDDDAKSKPEQITIVLERMEKPREHFFEDLEGD